MAGLADLQSRLAAYFGYLPRLEGHPESGMPPLSPGMPPMEQYPRGPFDPEITPLTPVPRPPLNKDLSFQVDPSAPPMAALGAMFPYLQQPTGLASMQPNAAGKIPEVDPLAGWQPILQGAVDMASFAGPEMAAKLAPAALHLIPLVREGSYLGRTLGEHTKYQVIDDLGQHVIDLNTTFNPQNKRMYVDWIGLRGAENMSNTEMQDLAAGRIGSKEMMSLLKALRYDYPEMRSLTGERISGGRYAAEQYAAEKGQQIMTSDPVIRFKGPPTEPPPSKPPAVQAAFDENARRLQIERLTRERAVDRSGEDDVLRRFQELASGFGMPIR